MELKDYQRGVLDEIARYAGAYAVIGDAATAYGVFLNAIGLAPGKGGVPAYVDDLGGIPRVCAKVPTGGGKTLIGAAAIDVITDALPAHDDVVVWLVPRREILTQTLRNMRDPSHFLRAQLDRDFAGRVDVLSKEDGLAGRGFNASTVGDGLTLFVLSYDSFKNKEGRRAFAENSALAGLTELQRAAGTAVGIEDADSTALISALAGSNPIVIVDESHHAGSKLSLGMLRNLNPRFVLELTATPDPKHSNVIARAKARQLKAEEMVKLPVVVYRRPDKRTVVADAVTLQRRLEAVAEQDERRTGRYIRPIVLFQAEPRGIDGAATFDLLKTRLLEAGVPEEWVAVRTGDVDEIGKADLMDRACPIRFIITVEALAEGWDCPFAYVLATVANKSSKVSVEQIVGRVLRQPYAHRAASRCLDIAYVLTSSADFDGTVQQVVNGLNGVGFSQEDVIGDAEIPVTPSLLTPGDRDAADPASDMEGIGRLDLHWDGLSAADSLPDGLVPASGGASKAAADAIVASADSLEGLYEEGSGGDETVAGGILCSIGGGDGLRRMRAAVREGASGLLIPQFMLEVDGGLFASERVPLERENLLSEFKLSQYGIDGVKIDSTAFSDARAVDLTEDSDAYKIRRLDAEVRKNMRLLFSDLSDEGKRDGLVSAVLQATTTQFRNVYGENQIKAYIRRVVESMDLPTVEACFDSVASTANAVQNAVRSLADDFCEQKFRTYVSSGRITCEAAYRLPDALQLTHPVDVYAQTLYEAEEGDMDGTERKMADLLSNSERIRWWHRVVERRKGEFRINGFINHYPDFLAMTESGTLMAIETKGGHLTGDDTKRKLELGTRWADMAGCGFTYCMVFEDEKIEAANSFTFAEFSADILG